MLDGFDLTTIHDESLRTIVRFLMNQVEDLAAKVRHQADEIQRLRDENNRLKGEHGQPTIKPNRPALACSSTHERAIPQARCTRAKQATLRIDRTETLMVDRATLPHDARFKGYHQVRVQDLRLTTDTVCFRKEKWYSPSLRQTFLAANPPGYEGQFGPHLKAFVLTLAFESGMSERSIRRVLTLAGISISVGQLSQLIITNHDAFHHDRMAILKAGFASSPWQHIDTTVTRVNGRTAHCHVVCNPLYTVYTTVPQADRQYALAVLQGGQPLQFRADSTSDRLLRLMDVPARDRTVLAALPRETMLTADVLDAFVLAHGQQFKAGTRKRLKDALAIAAYHAQRDPPIARPQLLIADDAPQWAMITQELALCWVHDARAYKKLLPRFPQHQQLVDAFLTQYWAYYRALRAYQAAPSSAEAVRLRAEFRQLFATVTGYAALDARIVMTAEKARGLLMVLDHPEIPLHNNPAELGVRRRVRKRDMSFGPRSDTGMQAWDTFQTLAATAAKLERNFYAYLYAMLCHDPLLVSLADEITTRAQANPLGSSWRETPPQPDWKPKVLSMWHG